MQLRKNPFINSYFYCEEGKIKQDHTIISKREDCFKIHSTKVVFRSFMCNTYMDLNIDVHLILYA